MKDGKVLVPKTPVSQAVEDPLEACRNALRPLADLMAAKKGQEGHQVQQADNGRLNPTKKPKRNPKKKIMTRKADKKEDVRESEDYVPSASEVDDDEYLPPGVKTSRKRVKKANQPKKAPR